jgi:hypothetical protein
LTPAKERGEDLGGFELLQRFEVIFAAKECATIFPFRTTNVSGPIVVHVIWRFCIPANAGVVTFDALLLQGELSARLCKL